MSQEVIGCFFFDLLRRVYEASFPNWNGGLPNANEGDNDDWRKMVRSKVWRSRCVLADQSDFPRHAVIAFVSVPIDRLWSRLQWLDQRGKILYDLCDNKGPFADCLKALLENASSNSGWYRALYWRYPDKLTMMLREVRWRTVCIAAQLWWRFMFLREWPYLWVKFVHPSSTATTRKDVGGSFFARSHCCLERDLAFESGEDVSNIDCVVVR